MPILDNQIIGKVLHDEYYLNPSSARDIPNECVLADAYIAAIKAEGGPSSAIEAEVVLDSYRPGRVVKLTFGAADGCQENHIMGLVENINAVQKFVASNYDLQSVVGSPCRVALLVNYAAGTKRITRLRPVAILPDVPPCKGSDEVKRCQIWRHVDKRDGNRRLYINRVAHNYAWVTNIETQHETRVRVNRFIVPSENYALESQPANV